MTFAAAKSAASTDTAISLREWVEASGTGCTVDREACMIRNAKLLGRESGNGRVYSNKAMQEAAALYIGKPVYFDHNLKEGSNRRYCDHFGEVLTTVVRNSGVYGDIKYKGKHAFAEQVLDDIETNRPGVGISPDHYGNGPVGANGKHMVETIRHVKSVDIVANPATNRSFSESLNDDQGNSAMELAEALTKISELTTANAALTGDNAKLQECIDGYKAGEKKAAHKTAVSTLLREAKIPEKAQTTDFLALLESSTIELATAAVKSLADKLGSGGAKSVSGSAHLSESRKDAGGNSGEAFDPESFASSLQGS